jgi:vacuolar iron transporter family protein
LTWTILESTCKRREYLGLLDPLAMRAGSTRVMPSAIRVMFRGVVAMGVTAGVGPLFAVAA